MLRKLVLDGMRCRRCNRVLTDSKSIKRGIGPICLHKEHKEAEKTPRTNIWDHVYARETAKRNRMNGDDVWHRLIKHGDAGKNA